jgi:hypothetical protein
MKVTQVRERASQLDDVVRAAGINPQRQVFTNGEIVNRREMKHARRLSLDQIEVGGAQREPRLADVSLDKLKLSYISAAKLRNPRNLVAGPSKQRRLHEQDEIAVLERESFEEPVRDEARESSYEKCLSIRHRLP